MKQEDKHLLIPISAISVKNVVQEHKRLTQGKKPGFFGGRVYIEAETQGGKLTGLHCRKVSFFERIAHILFNALKNCNIGSIATLCLAADKEVDSPFKGLEEGDAELSAAFDYMNTICQKSKTSKANKLCFQKLIRRHNAPKDPSRAQDNPEPKKKRDCLATGKHSRSAS